MADFQLRNGKLIKIQSRAVLKNEWLFRVAIIELEGRMFSPTFSLTDSVDKFPITPVLKLLLDEKFDAIWVRARIKSIFGIDIVNNEERIEKSLSFFHSLPAGRMMAQL
jgi:hypothetical protein